MRVDSEKARLIDWVLWHSNLEDYVMPNPIYTLSLPLSLTLSPPALTHTYIYMKINDEKESDSMKKN